MYLFRLEASVLGSRLEVQFLQRLVRHHPMEEAVEERECIFGVLELQVVYFQLRRHQECCDRRQQRTVELGMRRMAGCTPKVDAIRMNNFFLP